MLCMYYQLKFQIQFEKFDPICKVSNQIAKPASTAKLPLQSCLSKSIPIKEKEFTMDFACVFSYSISRLSNRNLSTGKLANPSPLPMLWSEGRGRRISQSVTGNQVRWQIT